MKSNVTLKHIAEELGLSVMTVSRAINNRGSIDEKTQLRVLETARKMGYTPNHLAKSLVSKKTYTIGVVVPEISHSFFPEVIRGIEEIIYEKDYQIILGHASESVEREKKVIEMLRSKRVDGLLVSTCQKTTDFSFFENLTKSGTTLVFFDRCIEEIGVSCVSVNDRTGSEYITQHLIDLGYKKLAHLSGSREVSIGKDRFQGFKKAVLGNNLELKEKWIIESGFQEEGGFRAMSELLEIPKKEWPDAVVAVNDPSAFGAIEAINQKGLRIPEDIAIVGFSDDIRASLLEVPLTTVEQPAYEVGKKAANKLIRLIENESEQHERISIMTSLKIRSTCGFELKKDQ